MIRVSRSLVVAWITLVPSLAYAQASITGVVRDSSGAVLPGVTVEAASPALIEKQRSVVTDGTGQYRVVDLRPGSYSVTFTLPGFNTVKRDGIELTGSFTASVNAEMRVGAVEETITVTGETPIVDVQGTTRQRVMEQDVIESIPTSRGERNLALLIPGVSASSATGAVTQDVGGTIDNQGTTMVVHGSRAADQRLSTNGISINVSVGTGSVNSQQQHVSAYQEVVVDAGAVSAEMATGGVRLNFIPKDGGNTFKGSTFASIATGGMQGSNYTEELQRQGLRTPTGIKKLWDIDPGLGGPVKRDRLWFYVTGRYSGSDNYPAGTSYNLNANNPTAWTYAPDTSQRAFNHTTSRDAMIRLTWQATDKNKIGFGVERATSCYCTATSAATTAPEAAVWRKFPSMGNLLGDWNSPLTNRLLLEGAINRRHEDVDRQIPPDTNPLMVSVTDQGLGNLVYRAVPMSQLRIVHYRTLYTRFAMSYITGAHSFKTGVTLGHATEHQINKVGTQPYEFRFNNGVPNLITLFANPYETDFHVDQDTGAFAQDKWTLRRLTLSGGVRLDLYKTSFPEQHLGPAPLVPARNIDFPATEGISWKDITPRMGASYDLRGDGKTALKVTLNKYVEGQGSGSLFGSALGSASRVVQSTTRSWTDTNRNFIPDCNLTNPTLNGECGALADPNLGRDRPASTYDDAVRNGWGKRPFNWEFSAGVQREVLPRTSVDISYFRRWYGNFFVTDNRTVAASDYNAFTVTAPADPRLPGGGGYTISGLRDLNPAKFGLPADNLITAASNYGKQIERWNGVDLTMNTRPRQGVTLQGGISTGRVITDNCEILAQLPEMSAALQSSGAGIPFCHQQQPFQTQVKLLGTYTIPRIDLLISGTLQNIPGPMIFATFNAPTALVAPSLGRPLSGNAANTPVPLVAANSMYNDRLNQLDLRIGKIVRIATTRTLVNVDVYNALNAATILSQNNSFGGATPWLQPQSILSSRFAKLSVQFDF